MSDLFGFKVVFFQIQSRRFISQKDDLAKEGS